MNAFVKVKNWFRSLSAIQWIAIGLIIVGLALAVVFGTRLFRPHGGRGFGPPPPPRAAEARNPDARQIRPWMNIRFIAVSFAVPQEYLFVAAGIPMNEKNSKTPIDRLNAEYKFGTVDGELMLIVKLRKAVEEYKANPVPTGLTEDGVRGWMSIQYIANSTGIPAGEICQQLGIAVQGNTDLPLEMLAEKVKYAGGPKALVSAVQKIVNTAGKKP